MKETLLNFIQCPICESRFIVNNPVEKNGEIYEGSLKCEKCQIEYDIINYIPRFIKQNNYSSSWGELWGNSGNTLRDSDTGSSFYYDTLFGKWSEENLGDLGCSPFGFEWGTNLKGERILEIGPGLGVCTEHLVNTGAEIL